MDLRWYISFLGHEKVSSQTSNLKTSKIPYGTFVTFHIFQNIFFMHCIPNIFCDFFLAINIKQFICKCTKNGMSNLFISNFLGRQNFIIIFWFWVSQNMSQVHYINCQKKKKKKTFSYHLWKNVLLKGSIIEVSGCVWTREASIRIYLKIVVWRIKNK